jgi:hypothetical protein
VPPIARNRNSVSEGLHVSWQASHAKGQAQRKRTKPHCIHACWLSKVSGQAPIANLMKIECNSPQLIVPRNISVSGQPGSSLYPGMHARSPIRAVGQRSLSGQLGKAAQSGRTTYPGSRAEQSIRAVRQNSISRQSGRTLYPGSWAEQSAQICLGRALNPRHIRIFAFVRRAFVKERIEKAINRTQIC